jgi:Fic family protein
LLFREAPVTAKAQNGFAPVFSITPAIARALMRIEAARQAVLTLPVTPRVLARLRETARLFTTHYSTMIEGNRLTQEQVAQVIGAGQHFPGRERDQDEVKGYYAALDEVERLAALGERVTEAALRRLHALVMGSGRARVKPTPYRDGQNVIRDSRSNEIVYLPPEAQDVPRLMAQFIAWLSTDVDPGEELPVPVKAAIAHYQYATIHPYYDGNGRTARLLTTLVLDLGGYDLKGLYALEEYYARNLGAYYEALTIGSSANYYMGRAEADITRWIAYFTDGMADSFEKVREQASREARTGVADLSAPLRNLDARQRKALALFENSQELTAREISGLFGYQPRTASELCRRWVEQGFLEVADAAKKTRRYRLAEPYEAMVSNR